MVEPQHIGVSAGHLAACLDAAVDAEIEVNAGANAIADDATALAFHRGGTVNMPWLSDGE
ncbi:hypothetical protein BRM22_25290 [Xanthomonas oryzae pv. oryzae]|uniref:Uncharacterized protein n=1 Tax=Xanthomonas oryzae pv. oryzae TaxID=64187 RepID=A0A854DIM2_XANOO|nr:hypothetical protein APZ20_07890 [Xanthomonas oryzae pv. oryzae]QUW77678.1 hypothetical protein KCI36_12590 [Xanthomonas oryzae]AOS03196.1 hypothetical protein ATY42_15100 [Xanthomonas oryzae pv. oryzae]AOS06571.1 hypothetical protein ATY43_11350 [Xanthomonas oryzae pv. oryzae]AOS10250.1 hypothetical protein ATY44_07940 [Xanthomonas oryzae pv. oryzae]